MSIRTLFDVLSSKLSPSRTRRQRRAIRQRIAAARRPLQLEALEDRRVLAFAAPVSYDVGSNPQAVVSAYLNNDAVLDLAVANFGSTNLSVLLGNGLGGFGAKADYSTGADPRSLAVGDVSGDGEIDLITANAADVSILRGDGLGSFAPPDSIALPGQFPPDYRYTGTDPLAQSPQSLATGDFNGDGLLDLAVTGVTSFTYSYTGYYGGTYYQQVDNAYVNVLISNGSGGFNPTVTTALGGLYPNSLVTGRFNTDANDDLAITNSTYGTVSVLLSDGAGGFSSGADYGVSYYPWSVAARDVNGDLKSDLVVANRYGYGVSVLLGNGSGGFAAAGNYAVGGEPLSVAVGDINADGKLDLVTSSNFPTCTSSGYYGCYDGYYTGQVNVLLGHDDGSFASPTSHVLEAGTYASGVAVGDFDGDGLPDVAVTNSDADSGNAAVLINTGGWVLPARLSIGDATVTEGNGGTVAAVFTVTRNGSLAGEVSVSYSTANGGALAGSDYVAKSETLIFADGETTKTVTILVNGDLTDEFDQGFYVNLSAPSGAVISDSQGFGNIVDNDPPPTITITAKVSAKEGNNNATKLFNFIVTLSAASEKEVRVNFATANGSATTGDNDYVANSGTLTFAPGVTSQTISVTVKGDKRKESNETFFVDLSGGTNATIASARGIGEILDDDSPPGKGR